MAIRLAGLVVVGMADDEAVRGEHEHRDMAADRLLVQGGLLVHEVSDDLIARHGRAHHVNHEGGQISCVLNVLA